MIDVQQRKITELAHEIRTPLNAVIGYAQITSKEVLGKIKNIEAKFKFMDETTVDSLLFGYMTRV